MPVESPATIVQSDRNSRVTSGSPANFFHIAHSTDIDISVTGILGTGYITSVPTDPSSGDKYITAPGSELSIEGSSNNDILQWDGNEWRMYLDVSNPLSDFGMVYDRTTRKVYHFDSSNGWRPLIAANGTIDGGTFP